MGIKQILVRFRNIFVGLSIKCRQKTYNNRLHYIFNDNGSDRLLIVFSAFGGEKPTYNYMRTLRNVKADQLFVLDDFGYRGSYYWFENGDSRPSELVRGLIRQVLDSKKYSDVRTIGSSKGGSCAIYYGLEIGAKEIYAGACQYYVGNYLYTDKHMRIFKSMMGEAASMPACDELNGMLPKQICKFESSMSVVNLLYSKNEHTYDEHIIHLLEDLQKTNIAVREIIKDFTNHSDVGQHFSLYLKQELNNI